MTWKVKIPEKNKRFIRETHTKFIVEEQIAYVVREDRESLRFIIKSLLSNCYQEIFGKKKFLNKIKNK